VRAAHPILIELDTRTLRERCWEILPPVDDTDLTTANFHSAFYFEEDGHQFVGLLKTGVVLETLVAHPDANEHTVRPAPPSTIWLVKLDGSATVLQAETIQIGRASCRE